MGDEEKRSSEPEEDGSEEYGWEFHKIPLLIAVVLTVIFYVIVYWLSSMRG
jgi:hypothetical protein